MDWQRIGRGRRPGSVADLLDVARPCDSKTLRSPYALKQGAIGPLRDAIDRAGDVGQPHLHGIGRRPLCLFGRRIAEPASRRAHIPEIAADEVAPPGIVMQHGRQRRVGV